MTQDADPLLHQACCKLELAVRFAGQWLSENVSRDVANLGSVRH